MGVRNVYAAAKQRRTRVNIVEWTMSIRNFARGIAHPYQLPSVGPGADVGVQAVSPQVTISHSSGGRLRLPLHSAKPAVTFPAAEHHRFLSGTKLYCLVTEAHRCEQLAQGCTQLLPRVRFEPTTCWSQVQLSTRCATVEESYGIRNFGHRGVSCMVSRHNKAVQNLIIEPDNCGRCIGRLVIVVM